MIECVCRRGWIPGRMLGGEIVDWPVACKLCGGKGQFTFYTLSGVIGEDERSIRRVYEMHPRVRRRTFQRVFEAVTAVLA